MNADEEAGKARARGSGTAAPTSALSGLIVADFSRVLAGPLATMMLGDLGATVIKVEEPGRGDYLRLWPPYWPNAEGQVMAAAFAALNRNKASITVDLKSPPGQSAVHALAAVHDRPDVAPPHAVGCADHVDPFHIAVSAPLIAVQTVADEQETSNAAPSRFGGVCIAQLVPSQRWITVAYWNLML